MIIACIYIAASLMLLAAALIQRKNMSAKQDLARMEADIERTKHKTAIIRKKNILLEDKLNAGRVMAEKELASMKTMIYECNMAIVDQISPYDFEEFVARLLSHNGYTQVDTTPASGDKGADVIAIDPNGRKTCFQCKHYKNSVGTAAVQEVIAAAQYYGCSSMAVITTSTFTRQARELAQQAGVFLMDRNYLSCLMENCISECVSAVRNKAEFINSIAAAREKANQQLYDSL